MKKIIVIISVLFLNSHVFSQQHTKFLGAEFRAYPAGIILGARGTFELKKNLKIIGIVGTNITDRQDFGVHDHEEGSGWGGLVGCHYHPFNNIKGIFVGLEVFIWRLSIDWMDRQPLMNDNTDITVFQPAFKGGYLFANQSKNLFLELGFAFGQEINIVTIGKPVGQGGISMIYIATGIKI